MKQTARSNALRVAAAAALATVSMHSQAIYKCTDESGAVAYRDAPCIGIERSARLDISTQREIAVEKRAAAAPSRQQADGGAAKLVHEAAAVDPAYEGKRLRFLAALEEIRVGMTDAELYTLSPMLATAGRSRYVESVNGRTEWRTYPANGMTVTLHNGRVMFIHR